MTSPEFCVKGHPDGFLSLALCGSFDFQVKNMIAENSWQLLRWLMLGPNSRNLGSLKGSYPYKVGHLL